MTIGVGAVGVAVGLACAEPDARPSAIDLLAGPDGGPPARIVLFVVDASALDRAVDSGATLGRLGREGALFTDLVAASARPGPAIASLLTGRWPHEHGYGLEPGPLAATIPTLPRTFAGGAPIAVASECDGELARALLPGAFALSETAATGTEATSVFELHLALGPCTQRVGAEEADRTTVLDSTIAASLERLALFDRTDTLVAVVGQRGRIDPLAPGGLEASMLLWWPGIVPANVRIERPVSSLDLAPTLAALARTDLDASGQSLLPLLALGEAPALLGYRRGPIFSESWRAVDAGVELTAEAIVLDGWKLVRAPREDGEPEVRLFDRALDPLDRRDVADRHPRVVRRLRGLLDAWRAGD